MKIKGFSNLSTEIRTEIDSIEKKAREKNVEIDPSFYFELLNYIQRKDVKFLSESAKAHVIEEFGKDALKKGGGKLGAGFIRYKLSGECEDPFSTCSEVAERMISKDYPDEAAKLRAYRKRVLDKGARKSGKTPGFKGRSR